MIVTAQKEPFSRNDRSEETGQARLTLGAGHHLEIRGEMGQRRFP